MRTSLLTLPRCLSRHPGTVTAITTQRLLSTSPRHQSRNPFSPGPSPPRLPKEEQEIFERLQRESTGAFSTPRRPEAPTEETPAQTYTSSSSPADLRARINQSPLPSEAPNAQGETGSPGADEMHPNLRRGAPPEFVGEVNPKTGEVGGPKNEPLRWGTQGDWSFNGRVTDF